MNKTFTFLLIFSLSFSPLFATPKERVAAEHNYDENDEETDYMLDLDDEEDIENEAMPTTLDYSEHESELSTTITTPAIDTSTPHKRKLDKIPTFVIVIGASIVTLIGGILAVHSNMGEEYPN